MSVPHYGRVTPLQGDMLGLGGEILHVLGGRPTDEQRVAEMKASRAVLCKITGQDFGFDLSAWHAFLISSEDYAEEYTFPYAWKAVERKISELMTDANRIRLVGLIAAESGD